ncbi:MAG: DinB family protein [Chloroflexi bacterium]|nr:DinB family protein [Chloroflexota bacterium]
MTDESRRLIETLVLIPTKIGEAIKRAESKPQPEGEWPLRTIVVHLIAVEREVWQYRLHSIVAEDNPHWQYTEPPLAEWESHYARYSLPQILYAFALIRQETANHLRRLTEAGWKRIGTHAKYGEMDVAGLCGRILEHDEEHLAELNKRGA